MWNICLKCGQQTSQAPYIYIYIYTYIERGTYTSMLHLPFSDLPLKQCLIVAQSEANPCYVANFGFVAFSSCFVGSSAVLRLGTPNSPLVLFQTQNGPFCTPKHNGEMSNLDTRNAIKTCGEKRQKDRWFHAVSPHDVCWVLLMFEECPLPQSPCYPTIRVETWVSRMCRLGIPKWLMPF